MPRAATTCQEIWNDEFGYAWFDRLEYQRMSVMHIIDLLGGEWGGVTRFGGIKVFLPENYRQKQAILTLCDRLGYTEQERFAGGEDEIVIANAPKS